MLLRLMTATSRVVVVLYGVVGLFVSIGVSQHTWGDWPIGMALGSVAVLAGALLSRRRPAGGGFIVVLGTIAGVTTFAFGDYAGCKPPAGTCTAGDEFDLALAIAFIPVILGLSWMIGAFAQGFRLGAIGWVSVSVVLAIVFVAGVATGHGLGFLPLILALAAAFAAFRAWKRKDLKPLSCGGPVRTRRKEHRD